MYHPSKSITQPPALLSHSTLSPIGAGTSQREGSDPTVSSSPQYQMLQKASMVWKSKHQEREGVFHDGAREYPWLNLAPTMAVCWLFQTGQVVYFSEPPFVLTMLPNWLTG